MSTSINVFCVSCFKAVDSSEKKIVLVFMLFVCPLGQLR